MNVYQFLILAAVVGTLKGQTQSEVDANIAFTVYVKDTNLTYNSTFTDTQFATNCPSTTPVTLIIHGWTEGMHSLWAKPMINLFLQHAGGCVIFMDYSKYSVVGDYFVLVDQYWLILETLRKKILQIGNQERLFVWGFSFGSRLAQGVGYNLTMANGGVPKINRMDLCDPAGPGFDGSNKEVADITKAASNVQCIHTSSDKGTPYFKCKQSFVMGYYGVWQIAQTSSPKMSHGLCPYFYMNAFTNQFVNNNYHGYTHARQLNNTVLNGARMGFYNNNYFNGVCFIATARCHPFVLVNGTIYNYQPGTGVCAA